MVMVDTPMMIRLLAGGAACLSLCATTLRAQGKLIYDEEKGVIFSGSEPTPKKPERREPAAIRESLPQTKAQPRISPSKNDDIHTGRKKDPPEVYFKSGLECFKARDYDNALKYFLFADSADPQPSCALWVGKTYRQLERPSQMLFEMNRILKTYPESDVADDALFEITLYSQTTDDYEKATLLYSRLAEQYPFGKSFSNGQEFREVARMQIQAMRDEVAATLARLGFASGDIDADIKAFQKARGLPITGQPDAGTVKAMKTVDAERLAAADRIAQARERMKKQVKPAVGIALAFLVNFILLLNVNARIRGRKRQLATLLQTLSDLKTTAGV